jgi:putative ATP-binding cassette transporter
MSVPGADIGAFGPGSRPRGAAWLFARLAAPYWSGQRRWRARGATLLLFALTVAQVGLVIWISY